MVTPKLFELCTKISAWFSYESVFEMERQLFVRNGRKTLVSGAGFEHMLLVMEQTETAITGAVTFIVPQV